LPAQLRDQEQKVAHHLNIEYGDDVLLAAAMSKEDFDAEARLLLAAKLFELGKLSSGQAAQLCGRGRVEFLLALERVGVSMVNQRSEDAEVETSILDHA
jgi:predicted HTH domain antitoxin